VISRTALSLLLVRRQLVSQSPAVPMPDLRDSGVVKLLTLTRPY